MDNEVNEIYCTKCGAKNTFANNFCTQCGMNLKINGSSDEQIIKNELKESKSDYKTPKKFSFLIIIFFIVSFLWCIGIGIENLIFFAILLITYSLWGNASNVYGIILKVIAGILMFFIVSFLILYGVCYFFLF